MFVTPSFIALCVSLLAQGAVVSPGGLLASEVATILEPAVTPALNGVSHQPLSNEGLYGGNSGRHPAPIPITSSLPTSVLPHTCTGSGGGAGNSSSGVSSSQIIILLHGITTTANNLNGAVSGLTTSLQPSEVTSISKVLIQGFAAIAASLAKEVAAFPFTPPFSNSVTYAVVDALIGFLRAHQLLLTTVIGKHTIFAQFSLTAPIVAALCTVGSAINVFAFAIIGLIPMKKDTILAQISTVDITSKTSVNIYSEICSPSTTYPQTKPTCVKTN